MRVKLRPEARASRHYEPGEEGLRHARTKGPPVAAKARLELRKLVSTHFKYPLKSVMIKRGNLPESKCCKSMINEHLLLR